MAFTFIACAAGAADATGTTLDATTSLDVAVGDLLVAWCKHEGANGTFAVAKDTGTPANTFTFDAGDEVNHGVNGDLNGSMGYVLSAAADATATFRFTTASRPFRRFGVLQFRPDAGETVTKDAGATGQGTGTAPASGTITTTGTDEVVVGGYGEYNAITTTSELINAGAATEPACSPFGGLYASAWYRILTATFSNGTASATISSADWICNVIAFKAEAVGGGTAYQLEQSAVDRYLLEDATGVLLLEQQGGTIVDADGSSLGLATVLSDGRAVWNSGGAASGIAASSVLGNALWLGLGSAIGAATVNAPSGTVLPGVGASAGAATGSVIAAAIGGTLGASAGVGEVLGVGGATAGSVGNAAGTAADSVVGAAFWATLGNAAGLAEALGLGADAGGSIASATGIAVGDFQGAAQWSAVGTAVGIAVGDFQGEDASVGPSAVSPYIIIMRHRGHR